MINPEDLPEEVCQLLADAYAWCEFEIGNPEEIADRINDIFDPPSEKLPNNVYYMSEYRDV